ncbi:MAG: glycosyltransferase [Pirellulaceae bacterium]|nr:glycosyltransferase [Pirellulaceae bacterium]
MNLTVAICTWNRADLLDQTLDGLADLAIPAGVTGEVVVVNNRCTDHTDQVLDRHRRRLPLVTLREERAGLSHARNAAICAASGDWILWTDDDVLVDPRWLAEIVAAIRAMPSASFFGGPIEPWFECEPPDWLAANWRQFRSAFAIRDLGPEPFDFDTTRLPFGANYAVRRDVQRQFPYDQRLGRSGGGTIGGEETAVLRALLAAGHRGRWVPTARVRHFLPRERLTLDYVRRFYRGVGQTERIRTGPIAAGSSWLRQLAAATSTAWFAALHSLPTVRGSLWAKALIRSSQRVGRLAA